MRLRQLKEKFELQQRRETVMREEELLEVRSTIEQARLRVQIVEEDQSEECFDRSYGPPRATSVPEIKRYDQRTDVYSNVESGLTPEMKRNMPSRPSRDDTYARADLDPATSRHVDTRADLDPATSRALTHIQVSNLPCPATFTYVLTLILSLEWSATRQAGIATTIVLHPD